MLAHIFAGKYVHIMAGNLEINYSNGFDTVVFSIKFTWLERSTGCIFLAVNIVFVLKLLL